MTHENGTPDTPEWTVTPHAPPEWDAGRMSADVPAIPPNVILGAE